MFILFAVLFISMFSSAFAAPVPCAVCAFAIAGGLGIASKLGISDAAVGVWAGALLYVISKMIIAYLVKKNINKNWVNALVYLSFYVLGIVPLYLNGSLTLWKNTILGVDDFLLSVIIGTGTLISALKLYYYMKAKNGKPHFPFEKVVLPLTSIILVSILFNYVG
ncbi:MAG: hypothetical protein Ta2D_09360 [Rickettsiales bacterium]|nr:MAG: hypothetical protein Ta2D_09360 [Rickettsiales bacterium]